MKTHANEPTEIALLNHVSSYVGSTCYVVHRLDKEPAGRFYLPKILLSYPFSTAFLEDKKIQREYWALIQGSLAQKTIIYKDKIGRDRHDRAQAPGRSTQGAVCRNPGDATEKNRAKQPGQMPAQDGAYPSNPGASLPSWAPDYRGSSL